MIIKRNSPLRYIPSQLNAEQTMFLDGIRYSIEMADVSYKQLKRTLLAVTKRGLNHQISNKDTVKVLTNTWSIIDSVNRLRELLSNMRGIVKKAPPRIIFMKNTKEVKNLRNVIQHMNTRKEMENLLKTNSAALGSLTWSVPSKENKENTYSCFLRPGTIINKTAPFKIHTDIVMNPINNITLSIGSNDVCLGDVMQSVEVLAKSLESELRAQFKGLSPANIDFFGYFEISQKDDA